MTGLYLAQLSARPENIVVPARLGVFLALEFAWSWGCWLLSAMLNAESSIAANLLFFIGGFGPSIAAVAVVADGGGRAGLHIWLQRCLQWREGWGWMLLAFLFPIAFMELAAALDVVLGGTLPPSPAAGHVSMVVMNFFLIILIGGPLGEEFGWRGHALPALQVRWGWRVASLVLGVVWALWHLPLFYLVGTAQSHLPMALFALMTIASSVVFAWLKPHGWQCAARPGAPHRRQWLVFGHTGDGDAGRKQSAAVPDRGRHTDPDGSSLAAAR